MHESQCRRRRFARKRPFCSAQGKPGRPLSLKNLNSLLCPGRHKTPACAPLNVSFARKRRLPRKGESKLSPQYIFIYSAPHIINYLKYIQALFWRIYRNEMIMNASESTRVIYRSWKDTAVRFTNTRWKAGRQVIEHCKRAFASTTLFLRWANNEQFSKQYFCWSKRQ